MSEEVIEELETVIELKLNDSEDVYKKFETPEVFKQWIESEQAYWNWVPLY
jgi:hypothetical protein